MGYAVPVRSSSMHLSSKYKRALGRESESDFIYLQAQCSVRYIMVEAHVEVWQELSYYKMELTGDSYKFKPQRIADKYADAPQYISNNFDYDIDELLMPANLLGEETYSYKDKLIKPLNLLSMNR